MWHVTRDTWHVTCDMWHVTCDKWHVTRDTCHLSYVTCHVSHVACHIFYFIFFYHPPPKKILVLWSASVERFIVSRMRDFSVRFSFYPCFLCNRLNNSLLQNSQLVLFLFLFHENVAIILNFNEVFPQSPLIYFPTFNFPVDLH